MEDESQDIAAVERTAEKAIKVAIVEDRREIREGLAMLIGGTEGFLCTGAYRSAEEALERMGTNCRTSC